jgi:hypothetical protein
MQFLKALFWLIVGSVVAAFLFANGGGQSIDIVIWGGLTLGVRRWFLLLILILLIGLLLTLLIRQTRLWLHKRRLDTRAQAHLVSPPAPARPATAVANTPLDRQATDAKAWPAQ